MVLVTENLDFTARELLCLEAVRFGQMSGDGRVRARTLYWRADTYISCYRQPKKALPLFKEALSSLESTVSCVRSQICIGLALAYAEVGEGGEALKNIEHAKSFVDRSVQAKRCEGHSGLAQLKGHVVAYEINGQIVLFNHQSLDVSRLNGTGTFIWQAVMQETTWSGVINRVLHSSLHASSFEETETLVRTFVQSLFDEGWITLAPGEKREDVLSTDNGNDLPTSF